MSLDVRLGDLSSSEDPHHSESLPQKRQNHQNLRRGKITKRFSSKKTNLFTTFSKSFILLLAITIFIQSCTLTNAQFTREVERRVKAIRKYWQQLLHPLHPVPRSSPRAPTTPYTTTTTTTTPITTTTTLTTTTAQTTPKNPFGSVGSPAPPIPINYGRSLPLLDDNELSSSSLSSTTSNSPYDILTSIVRRTAGDCGIRASSYMPHLPSKEHLDRVPRRRQGRIVWESNDTMGSRPAPEGTFPWMASLFVLFRSGEALFMCAAAVVTPNLLLTAAHCFTANKREETWFARVGDNYILQPDEFEQTFRVKRIIQHHLFDPLREGGGDGRHDIALVSLYPHRDGSLINFGRDVRPICFPKPDFPMPKLQDVHCEIAGWGMTEYNNTSSYPDSVRAARISVGDVPDNYCDYLYQRDVRATGKFCAGGSSVDACQEDSGGPLVCRFDNNRYHILGIVSSGKGCGVYPGLYTDVSRYIDWLAYWVQKESVLN